MLRRFGCITFFIVLIIAIFLTDGFNLSHTVNNNSYNEFSSKSEFVGVVKNIVVKENSVEYYLDDALIVDFTRQSTSNSSIIKIGYILKVYGKEKEISNLKIKDFDYGRYLKGKGIKRYLILDSYKIVGSDLFYSILGKIKAYIFNVNSYLYKSNSDILNAIVLGDKRGINYELKAIFSETGTSHILAISGLHIGIIVMIFVIMVGKITSLRKLIIVSVFMYLYFCLVGGGASIYRAMIMLIVYYISVFIDERYDIVNIASLIATYMIIDNNFIIYNMSFQLSFLSIISIGLFVKYVKKYISSNVISLTLASNILIVPIITYVFGSFSFVSIIGNLVALPLLSVIILLDFISIALYGIFFGLSVTTASVNDFFIDNVVFFLDKIGNYGINSLYIDKGNICFIVIYYYIVLVLNEFLEQYYISKNRFDKIDVNQ